MHCVVTYPEHPLLNIFQNHYQQCICSLLHRLPHSCSMAWSLLCHQTLLSMWLVSVFHQLSSLDHLRWQCCLEELQNQIRVYSLDKSETTRPVSLQATIEGSRVYHNHLPCVRSELDFLPECSSSSSYKYRLAN